MRKLGFICLTLLLAAGALGVVYSSWSQNLNTNAAVSIAQAPAVSTSGANVNTGNGSATLNGSLTQTAPGNTTVSVGFQYWDTATPAIVTTAAAGSVSALNDTFSAPITGLTAGHTYGYQSTGVGLFTVNSAPSTFTVNSTLTITTTSLPNGTVNIPYSQTLQASGGSGSYITWTISSGSLPNGLTLHNGNIISGTPTTTGLGSFTVKVTDSAGVTANATLSINIISGASKLVFSQQPTDTAPGAYISPSVIVKVEDINNNVVTTSSAVITIAITNNPSGGSLNGMLTVNAVNGVATFSTLSINATGTGYTLSVSSTGLTGATSSAFKITSGSSYQLSLETQPDGTGSVVPAQTLVAGGSGTVTAYAIERNAGGTFVANVAGTWSLADITGGVVSSELVPAGDSKSATFTDNPPHLAGSAIIHVVWNGTSAYSGTITVTPGNATLVFTTEPSSPSAGGTAFTTQPVVTLKDSYGNLLTNYTGTVSLAITSGTGTPGATLSATSRTVLLSNGVAAFSGVSVNWAGTGYTLTATMGSYVATSTSFSITAVTRTYTGTGSNDNFSQADHWSGGSVPGPGDNIIIINTCNFDNAANNFIYGALTLGGSTTGTLQWPAGGTNTLQVTNISAGVIGSKIDMTNGGTLKLSGTWTTTNMAFTAGTGTVNYNGIGAQTVTDIAYYNLMTSGSGIKTWTEGAARVMGGNLQIGDGTTLSIAGAYAWNVTGTTIVGNGASGILSVTNATGTKTFTGAVTINSGAALTETAAAALTFSSDVTIYGTLTEFGAAVVGFAGNITDNGAYTTSTGIHSFSGTTKTIGGTNAIVIQNVTMSSTYTNGGTLTISTALAGAGTLTNSATGTLNFGGSSITPTLTATAAGNTVNYSGAGAQTVKDVAYSNLTTSGSGIKTWTEGAARVIGGNLQIGDGTTLSIAGAYAWNVTGTTIVGNGTSGILSITNATGTKTFTGSVTINSGATLSEYAAASLSFGSDVAINGTLAINGAAPVSIAGNFTNNGIFTPATSTVTFNGTGNQTISGSAASTTFNNLSLTGSTNTNINMAATISGALNIGNGTTLTSGAYALIVTGTTSVGAGTSGSLAINNAAGTQTFTGAVTISAGGAIMESAAAALSFGSNVTITGTLTEFGTAVVSIAGNLTNNGTYTASTGMHTFSGAAKTISGSNAIVIQNVIVSGTYTNSGTLTISTTLAGAGTLTNGATGTLNFGGSSITPTLTATTAGNIVNYTGTGQTLKVTSYSNLILSGGAEQFGTITTVTNLTLNGAATATTGANLAISSNLIINSGTVFIIGANYTLGVTGTTSITGTYTDNSTGAKTLTGDVTINNGGVWSETAASIYTIAGNFTNNASTFSANTGTHTFNGASKTIGGSTSTSIPNVAITGTISNNSTLSVTTALSGAGTLTNGASGTLNLDGTCSIKTLSNSGMVTSSGTGTTTSTTLTNNGTFNMGSAGTVTAFTNGAAGILNISALPVPIITTLTVTASGNTVNYNGTGAQTVKAQAYLNLTLSGSGAKSIATGTSVGNKMSIASDSGSATASIGTGLTIQVRALFLAGMDQVTGTWGSTTSTAAHKTDLYFAATTGVLNVAVLSPIVASTTGNWATAATWTGGVVPTAADDVAINVAVTVGAAITQTGSVTINNGGTLTAVAANSTIGSLTINSGATLTCSRVLTVNGNTNITGTITLSGAQANIFAGNVTLNSGAVWNDTDTTSYAVSGSFTNNATTFSVSTAVYTFSGLGQTFSGSTMISIPSVTITGTYTNSGTLQCGTILTVTSPGVLTNGGTILTAALSGTGGVTQGTNSGLNIGSTSGITTLTATASGNTVNYFMGGQTVKSTNYYNLTLSGTNGADVLQAGTTAIGGTFTLSGTVSTTMVTGLTISGNLSIGTGTTFAASTYTLNVAGDWSNSGTFTGGTGTVTLNGVSAQTISGSTATTYYNLILSGSLAKTIPIGTVISNNLSIAPTGSATASIGAGLNITANTITLGGTLKPGTNATWGSTSSLATNKNDTYFTTGTTGILTVAH